MFPFPKSGHVLRSDSEKLGHNFIHAGGNRFLNPAFCKWMKLWPYGPVFELLLPPLAEAPPLSHALCQTWKLIKKPAFLTEKGEICDEMGILTPWGGDRYKTKTATGCPVAVSKCHP